MAARVTPKQLLSETQRVHAWGGLWQVLPQWSNLLACPGPDFAALQHNPDATLLKQSSARSIWRLRIGEHSVVAKVFDPPRRWSKIREAVLAPAGFREFITALYGRRRNLDVIRPVAYGHTESSRGEFRVFLTEDLAKTQPLSRYWLQQACPQGGRERCTDNRCIAALARFLSDLHAGGLLPSDLHADNILVTAADRFVLVDLHKARINVPCRHILRMLNLADLNQWFQRQASRTDRLRLLLAYLAFGFDAPAEALVRRYIAEVSGATQWKQDRLQRNRDKRVFGDNKYFGVLSLPGNWSAHVFLQAKRPLAGSQCSQLRFSKSEWAQALGELLTQAPADPPRTLRLGDHSITVRVEGPAPAGEDFRQRWGEDYRRINRHQAVQLPLALVEQRGDRGTARALYIVEQQ